MKSNQIVHVDFGPVYPTTVTFTRIDFRYWDNNAIRDYIPTKTSYARLNNAINNQYAPKIRRRKIAEREGSK